MFQDDLAIERFLELTGEFSNSQIDEEQDDDDRNEFPSFIEQSIADHKIIELKENCIPKGLVPLERLFLKDDILVKPALQSSEENVINCNIGIEIQPKIVKISKSLSKDSINKYISFCKKFVDIFAWCYEDLKTYDTSIIQHKILLSLIQNPSSIN